MKRFLKILLPIILAVSIISGIIWYLFFYDRALTQDIFVSCARHFVKKDNFDVADWFYDCAYKQDHDNDAVAIEVAENYMQAGNYTKAEVSLNRAIADGAGSKVYITLCKAYVAQDKLYDAVEMLDKLTDPALKAEIDKLRPAAPTSPISQSTTYNERISVPLESTGNTVYANPNGEYPSVLKHCYTEPITLSNGENIIYAVSVSENGLVSPLTIFKYTVFGVIEPVAFQDSAIEAAVRETLNIPDYKTVYSNDLWTIKEFTIPSEARNYSDIQYMLYLEKLTVDCGVADQFGAMINENETLINTLRHLTVNSVILSTKDMDMIGSFVNLESLTLDACGLSSTLKISTLTNLKELSLVNNAISDLSGLENMQSLQKLTLFRNIISDLTPIGACKNLVTLDLSINELVSLDPLAGLHKLTELNISDNKIASLTPLSDLTALSRLYAANNQITDIQPLAQCLALTYLDISRNQISSISPLAGNHYITYLNFSENLVASLPYWSGDCALVTIDGSRNLISDLSPLAGLKNLNNILMSYNADISVIDMLTDCPVLIQLDVYGTMITESEMTKPLEDQGIIVNYKTNTNREDTD